MSYEEINRDSIIWMYERMLTIRRFEEQARSCLLYTSDAADE